MLEALAHDFIMVRLHGNGGRLLKLPSVVSVRIDLTKKLILRYDHFAFKNHSNVQFDYYVRFGSMTCCWLERPSHRTVI